MESEGVRPALARARSAIDWKILYTTGGTRSLVSPILCARSGFIISPEDLVDRSGTRVAGLRCTCEPGLQRRTRDYGSAKHFGTSGIRGRKTSTGAQVSMIIYITTTLKIHPHHPLAKRNSTGSSFYQGMDRTGRRSITEHLLLEINRTDRLNQKWKIVAIDNENAKLTKRTGEVDVFSIILASVLDCTPL